MHEWGEGGGTWVRHALGEPAWLWPARAWLCSATLHTATHKAPPLLVFLPRPHTAPRNPTSSPVPPSTTTAAVSLLFFPVLAPPSFASPHYLARRAPSTVQNHGGF